MHTAVYSKNFIYVCGGLQGIDVELNQCEKYDTRINKWTGIPPMNTRRWGHCSVAHNNKLFVFGGRNGAPMMNLLSSVEVFDTDKNQWSAAADMPQALYSMACVAIGGKIYVCGK